MTNNLLPHRLDQNARYPILDALRFALAFWVVMGHFGMFPVFSAIDATAGVWPYFSPQLEHDRFWNSGRHRFFRHIRILHSPAFPRQQETLYWPLLCAALFTNSHPFDRHFADLEILARQAAPDPGR